MAQTIRERAREHLPQVLLTLLSIVQALALENLWSRVVERPDLLVMNLAAVNGWLQVTVTVMLIVLVWLLYVGLVMRFRWTPTIADLTWPFFVGLTQLLLIELMQLETLGEWYLVLTGVAVLLSLLTHDLFRKARRDPDNIEFFSRVGRSEWRDSVPRIVTAVLSLAIGGWLLVSGDTGWTALGCLLVSLVLVCWHIRESDYFWRLSVGAPSGGEVPPGETVQKVSPDPGDAR